jgi:predicted transcriptional regulator
MHAVNNGCDREDIYRRLLDPWSKGGFTCLRRKRANLRRWFERDWARAERLVASVPKLAERQGAVFMAHMLREEADVMDWRGTAGASDHAVYDALLQLAGQLGKLLGVGASVRQVAERAGLGREAISRSLRRLQRRGLIAQASAGHGRVSACWNLMPKLRSISDNQSHTPYLVVGPECPVDFAADCWRWRGLGKSKARVWSLLGPEPVTAANLAEFLNVKARTVQQHLAGLEIFGLATRGADGWVRGPTTPEQVSALLPTAGAGARQVERHRIEREAHRERLQRWAIEQTRPPLVDPDTGEIYSAYDFDEDDGPTDLDARIWGGDLHAWDTCTDQLEMAS